LKHIINTLTDYGLISSVLLEEATIPAPVFEAGGPHVLSRKESCCIHIKYVVLINAIFITEPSPTIYTNFTTMLPIIVKRIFYKCNQFIIVINRVKGRE